MDIKPRKHKKEAFASKIKPREKFKKFNGLNFDNLSAKY